MARRATSKKTTASQSNDRDVTLYADKAPTEFHKCFARWGVEEVGYKPTNRKDFLMGIAIATAARPVFSQSEYLANWREETGETKRGRKPKNEAQTSSKARSKPAPEPEPEVDYEDDQEEMEEREEELSALTVAKLRTVAKDDCEATAADVKGLNKAALVEFILDYEFPDGDDEDESEDDSDTAEDGDEEFDERQEELGEMTLTQLRKEAKELGATVGFLKSMKADAIREWILDEEFPEDEDADDEDSEEDEDEFEDETEEEEEPEEEEAPKSRRGRPSAKSSARTTKQQPAKGKSGAGAKSDPKYLF